MLRTTLLAVGLCFVSPAPAAAQAADPDLATGQLSWDVAGAMPDRSGCLGVSAEFDSAIADLLADARMQQIKDWVAHVQLPMPPRNPTAQPKQWTARSCLDAVQAVVQLLDANEDTIQRMAQTIKSAD